MRACLSVCAPLCVCACSGPLPSPFRPVQALEHVLLRSLACLFVCLPGQVQALENELDDAKRAKERFQVELRKAMQKNAQLESSGKLSSG